MCKTKIQPKLVYFNANKPTKKHDSYLAVTNYSEQISLSLEDAKATKLLDIFISSATTIRKKKDQNTKSNAKNVPQMQTTKTEWYYLNQNLDKHIGLNTIKRHTCTHVNMVRSKHFQSQSTTNNLMSSFTSFKVQLTPETLIKSLDEIEDPNKRAAP